MAPFMAFNGFRISCAMPAHIRPKVQSEQGFVPEDTFPQRCLMKSRIVVVTHQKWKQEMGDDCQNGDSGVIVQGVMEYNYFPRNLIFVDEHPSLVNLLERTPQHISALRDALFSLQADPEYIDMTTGSPDASIKPLSARMPGGPIWMPIL